MEKESILNILQHSSLFAGLNTEYISVIYKNGSIKELYKRDSLIQEGQTNHDIYIVLSGVFEIVLPKKINSMERVAKVDLSVIGPGEWAGEYSLVDQKPASASVIACVKSEVFVISRDRFKSLLDADHFLAQTVYFNLLRVLVGKIRVFVKEADAFCFV